MIFLVLLMCGISGGFINSAKPLESSEASDLSDMIIPPVEITMHAPVKDPVFQIIFTEEPKRTIDFLNSVYDYQGMM